MLTLLSILETIFRLFGFVKAADALLQAHEARVKAQNIANVPITDQEWQEKAKDGDL